MAATVREFEYFHGVVLTKVLRSERPVTLRLIETKPSQAWSAYKLNDELLLVKYRTEGRRLKSPKGARAWTFVLAPVELKLLAGDRVHLVLVCGSQEIGDPDAQVCLLHPDHIQNLIDTSAATQQSLTVRFEPGNSLRVYHNEQLVIIPRNSLDKWLVPGS